MAEPGLVDSKATFTFFSQLLDPRLLRALADMGFAHPTLVQAKAIPLALEGRDVLARARTGSGKTVAYCVPVAQKILTAKAVGFILFYHALMLKDETAVVFGITRSHPPSYSCFDSGANEGVVRAGFYIYQKSTCLL
jgi:superfamily II DNA/RNA helicase